jgi:membrane-bound lytic murein transglycosylase D
VSERIHQSGRLIRLLSVLVFLGGCAAQMTHKDPATNEKPEKRINTVKYDEVTDKEINLLNLDIKDVPNEYRYMVVKWLDYYQGRGRPHMERYLERSGRYLPLMKDTLKSSGLPEDLVYIPLIESGFSPSARSHAGAVGYWQFIRGTGKRYGLLIDQMVDERQDPMKSSVAAASYLKGLYSLFGSWYLAIASYNVGENRIQRSVMTHLTRSFWELAHRRALPRETVDYVPKFIAACMIAREPAKYGFVNIDFNHPFAFEIIESEQPVDMQKLAMLMNIPFENIKNINQAYRTRIAVSIRGKIEIRVPVGQKALAMENLEKAFTKVKGRLVAATGEGGVHRVQNGDNLSAIAKMYGTSVQAIRDENDLRSGALLRVGLLLRIPDGNGKRVKKKNSGARVELRQRIHKVRPGENLSSIAKRYQITVQNLIAENKLARKRRVAVGNILKIPGTVIR